jgi:hypothetical protein
MNKRLLLKLADLLEQVPEDKFDMQEWGHTDLPVGNTPRCITSACALGWATSIPECGLEIVVAYAGATRGVIRRIGKPGVTDVDAAVLAFGISRDDAERLFVCGMSMSAKEKAAQIRAFVESPR